MQEQRQESPSLPETYRIKIYSIGASNEAHGPAIPPNIDDFVAKRTALAVAEIIGADYIGHLPFSSDRVGDIALDWNVSYIPMQQLVQGTIEQITRDVERLKKLGSKKPSHIIIISGHGGNSFLSQKEEYLSTRLGIPVHYIPPFHNVVIQHPDYGLIEPSHADDCEHSIATHMNLINREGLQQLQELASEDPIEALKKWPSIMGLGGFVLPELSGPRYDALRKYVSENVARKFIKRKTVIADLKIGEQFLKANIDAAVKQVRKIAATN